MVAFLIALPIAFTALFGIFALLERFFPGRPGQARLRSGFKTDVAYWFINSPITRAVGFVAGIAALIVVALISGVPLDGQSLRDFVQRDNAISRQPIGLQVLELLVIADFTGYWTHRLFHFEKHLWGYHAIHHSSTDLDWLSSVRVHPLNDAAMTFIQALPLLLLGFEFGALGPFAAVLTFYAIFIHANLRWDFGPLRYAVASPVFHRWHHTTEREGIDKNFAGLLPLWDLLFGSFYMPKDRLPMEFGVLGEKIPAGWHRQLVYPFRRG